jgi:hypothetical protein
MSAPATPRWNAATRFGFRLWCVYFVMCLLPFTTVFLEGVGLWPRIANAVGRWPITHVLGWPEHSASIRIPGTDFLPDYLAMVALALFSVVLAIAWSLFDRDRPSYPRMFLWVHTTVRFVLASLMFWYGWGKILPAQFGADVSLSRLPLPVAQLTPMDLLWAFMSASRPYAIFAGMTEFAGGLLLLTRRAAMAGALISVAAMANVLMLNLAYDVNVKLPASVMLAMALFLLAPHATRLGRLFLFNRPTSPAPLPALFSNPRTDRIGRAVGAVIAVLIVYWAHGQAHVFADDNRAASQEPLYGIWMVEETTKNSVVAPPMLSDETLWRYMIVDDGMQVVTMSDAVTAYRSKIDSAARTIAFSPRPPAPGAAPGRAMSFRFSQADREHLELRRLGDDGIALVMRLRRIDPTTYPLVAHKHAWRW